MGIEIARLERELQKMAAEGAPGQRFCKAISQLAACGRFEQLRGVLPAVVYEELWERYKRDSRAFIAGWKRLAVEMQRGFIQHARQRLTSLTSLQEASDAKDIPQWQKIQRALDAQQNDLLRSAFAEELLGLIEPAVVRAAQLRECVVPAKSSGEIDLYLDEATRCYFFGLFTACAVMCRSVLEEALKEKLPGVLARQVRSRYRNVPTLGNLLHEVNNNLRLAKIDPEFPAVANKVNDMGKKGVHQGILSEDEARECLQNARAALRMLLQN
jgi:hypothetical protein